MSDEELPPQQYEQHPAQEQSNGGFEPPWTGFIETTGDALLILEAARRGIIPRVTRRLVEAERKMIDTGAVFVFDAEESGIKRWTDGFFWSPSRILGNFLLYRETDKKAHLRGRGPKPAVEVPQMNALPAYHNSLGGETAAERDERPGRALVGSLTDTYKFKQAGLMKKTFSLSIGGVSQHLISYYRPEDVESGRLKTPSNTPDLAQLDISPEYLDKTHFRIPPRVEAGEDGIPRYVGESEELDLSKPILTRETSPTKRERRFNPVAPKRTSSKKKDAAAVKTEEPAYPQALYMQPLYSTYQPYPPPDPAQPWQYPPYQLAPFPYGVPPPDGDGDEEDADGDEDLDAEGEEVATP
ncbi:hypothetical protein AURDEDRAFT_115700 [Auricularia subglabra TFB-10046 SS5]|uniref:Gti1/Pac2 family-domain-containing protein n=1 Tax=Auricularia subglabra (strain TFB-10046 / SS5) TaxID=717982 RepID=J0D266_AURST|nr:hypothetical protein AURDEDRAFT_115700 [Auricularia subglabra TFB-10046 SS5]